MSTRWISLAFAGVLLLAHSASAVVIRASESFVTPEEVAEVDVYLDSEGAAVAGVQADIEFPAEVEVQRRSDGRPDCLPNPDIDKGATSFAFVPCVTLPECESVRAIVLALDNVETIPDGSLLYSCRVVWREPTAFSFALPVVNTGASDPEGSALSARGAPGRISTDDESFGRIGIDDLALPEGGFGDLTVHLYSSGLGGLDVELVYDPALYLLDTSESVPLCELQDPAATGTFEFLPVGCDPDESCHAVHALIAATGGALTANATLFSCRVHARALTVPGRYPLSCGSVLGTDANGGSQFVDCSAGTLSVLANTPTPSLEPTGGPPVSATPSFTAALQRSVTPTVDPCGVCPRGAQCQIVNGAPLCFGPYATDDDGCAVGPRPRRLEWLSLLTFPAVCWLMRRCRR
jgi:hypothetical protein